MSRTLKTIIAILTFTMAIGLYETSVKLMGADHWPNKVVWIKRDKAPILPTREYREGSYPSTILPTLPHSPKDKPKLQKLNGCYSRIR